MSPARPRLMPSKSGSTASTGLPRLSLSANAQARLMRGGLWALVLVGASTGGLALAAGPDRTVAAPRSANDTATGPSGFAEMFVAAYLQAGEGREAQLRPFMSSVPSLTGVTGGHFYPARVATIDAIQVSAGYWSLTVAADVMADTKGTFRPIGMRYYRVSVTALAQRDDAAPAPTPTPIVDGISTLPAYVATALPMLVTPLPRADAPTSAFASAALTPDDPAQDTVTRFLSAYLAGVGELTRYTTPTSHLSAVTPSPYSSIEVTAIALPRGVTADHGATDPTEGAGLSVQASVSATNRDGAIEMLTYPLELTARGGRWEVTGLRLVDPIADPRALAVATPVATAPSVSEPTSAPSISN